MVFLVGRLGRLTRVIDSVFAHLEWLSLKIGGQEPIQMLRQSFPPLRLPGSDKSQHFWNPILYQPLGPGMAWTGHCFRCTCDQCQSHRKLVVLSGRPPSLWINHRAFWRRFSGVSHIIKHCINIPVTIPKYHQELSCILQSDITKSPSRIHIITTP